jgi:hypothetical protein
MAPHRLVQACLAAALATGLALAQDDLPYPQGKRFPLGLYSIETPEEMQAERAFGWNICHSYSTKPEYLDLAKQGGMLPLVHLDHGPEAAVGEAIKAVTGRSPVAWWDFPEEMRYWWEDELRVVKDLCAWTRLHDPDQRPNFMYNAGHYDAEALAHYVPYLDIIGAGAYTEYSHMPRAWVRWRMEQTVQSIALAGAKVGRDYLGGEKVPIGIPMLFYDPALMDLITPVEAYHDFYSCLAAGAKGILVFSYWHKRDQGMLQPTYDAYAKAAGEVSGPAGLGQALLFGTDVPVTCEVTAGAARTWTFRPYGAEEDISYPSVNVLAKAYEGKLYLIAVNSAEGDGSVKARVGGLPATLKAVTTPFEQQLDGKQKPTGQQRQLAVTDGQFDDSFGWLGVHVYVGELQ